jgi:acetoin utilization protein AcuC
MSDGKRGEIPFFYHPDISGYDFGPTHPFRGDRFERFIRELGERFPEQYDRLDIIEPELIGDDLLLLAHSRSYLDKVRILEKRRGFLSPDTQLLPGSGAAARLIVSSTVSATEAALETGLALAFGGLHHAGRSYGEGFCIFNDVAVATKVNLERGLDRIMIIDTDAHQGNGTMDVFYEEPRVLFVSLHQDPRTLYPGRGFVDEIGESAAAGYTVNIPMPVLAGGDEYDLALDEIVLPLVDEFKPQLIIRNGGSDPLYTDILTNLGLTLDELTNLIRRITDAAKRRRVPLVDLFISGYGPYVTEGWFAIIRGILNARMELQITEDVKNVPDEVKESIGREMRITLDELKTVLRPYWKCY